MLFSGITSSPSLGASREGDLDAPFDPAGPRRSVEFDADRWPDVSRIFAAAVALDPSARSGYLDEACVGDSELRSAVASLLAAHADAGSFGETIPATWPTTAHRLTPGTQLGAFRIEALIGAGGMGEVYRAYDTKLGRAVALKVLPDFFAGDVDRRGRFDEEARALAALNHPHIGAIYGVEDSGEVAALVLELVDGSTLAERLAAGPLPFDDILRIARQLADGLEAAHDRGIIHRDLKPANVKITPDGSVKILDFGLAKVEGLAARETSLEPQSPTLSRRATVAGAIVGTAAYMSPEQARGQAVDKRADIWAFGCVLFEMCARRPPFAGATSRDIRAAVLEREPEWQQLRRGTPSAVERLLRRCLTKDPKLRLRDIGEARIALARDADVEAAESPVRSASRRAWAVSTTLALTATLVAAWLYATRPSAPSLFEFGVDPPEGTVFAFHPGWTFMALSPDGTRLAFVASSFGAAEGSADSGNRIWIREISRIEPRPVAGTEGALSLFWSPDGRSLAFLANGKLKRVDVPAGAGDGTVVAICDVAGAPFTHGTWAGGVILLGRGDGRQIEAVSVADGVRRQILAARTENGEARLHWPWFLPDADRFLYTARLENGEGELRIGYLDGRSRTIMPLRSNAQWVDPDIVVFARDGVLMGQRVDLDAARPTGEPFPVAASVEYFGTTSRAMFSTSRSGDVAYHPGGSLAQLVWTDDDGRSVGSVGTPADYQVNAGRLSDDDSSLLTSRVQPGAGTHNIWRHDLVRNTEDQLTRGPGSELAPVWTDDGAGILFSADTAGLVPQLFHRNLATGVEERLVPSSTTQQHPTDVFADGSVAYVQVVPQGGFGLFKLPMRPRGPPIRLPSVGSAWGMRLSWGGRVMAFLAEDSGRKIYVAMVDGTSAPVLAAQGDVAVPRWSRDGRHVYFVKGDTIMSVPVSTTPRLTVGVARPLFTVQPYTSLVDVARDGRLLLLVPRVRAAERPMVVTLRALTSRQR